MSRWRLVAALWLAFAFVAWNVIFDRLVAGAAEEFTRDQILRYQQGDAVTSLDAGFTPRVRQAAWQAAFWVSPIVAAGAAASYYTLRRQR